MLPKSYFNDKTEQNWDKLIWANCT